ncbi:chromosome segregation protein SMC [Oceanomicrobium pacificus]|uniref:Chromosome partition protein Smc n=1 Tax=Oceanomicrobium pacificus TaxID=2692916 RepID=A0A6B0TT22_9RHOB|nr:chromosome segregation protein SMC [Oceanomicrobium pacificus]MXU64143.1 chromosome segregation protein SMC [Oceanomicrobium pacificus]
MQFTKLRLLGFKSFVDPTELVIAPGLTGVVGPNGCGKSNLLEALRWVMGENRPTAMRGGGMEDVIFAGASSRPARNFAEVTLTLDNSERLAPAAFNDSDGLEIVRRITRDAGSAYKTNGKESRARDVQMLFADASTGAHSPSLVGQGRIAELINAKPKARRRILEEAAGISGLYQRRHEAELKLRGAETNLARVEDVIEQLESQLNALARQARQAKRYREIATELRRSEGLLLYRRWREADVEWSEAQDRLRASTSDAATAQAAASAKSRERVAAEDAVPPLREEEAIAAAVLQRLQVERDTLRDQEDRARQTIETLTARIDQLEKDAERETALNQEAGEMIAQLDWEREAIDKAAIGHDEKLASANAAASDAAEGLKEAEAQLDRATEDSARLAARHQSATRRRDDAQGAVKRLTDELEADRTTLAQSAERLDTAKSAFEAAEAARTAAQTAAAAAEAALADAEAARSAAQSAESEARAALSETQGEAKALRAEHAALDRLIQRDSAGGEQLLDRVTANPGYEAALGAALADDLKAPVVGAGDASGWVALPDYDDAADLPDGASPLADHVTGPDVLRRRLSQIGVVSAADGPRLQEGLRPGQRLVSQKGDLWRWDGYRAGAEDAPSAATLRLQQTNRLKELATALAKADAAAAAADSAHGQCRAALDAAQAAEQTARADRRAADTALSDAARTLSRAEADRDMLSGRIETLQETVARRQDDVAGAERELKDAVDAVAELGDLEAARTVVEQAKLAVEAARLAMMSKRAMADELRRDGEARVKRQQEITKAVSGWKLRLDNAEKRVAEFEERIAGTRAELAAATAAPEELAAKRDELANAIDKAEARRKAAADALAAGETALREAEAAERAAERAAGDAREGRARAEAVTEAAAARRDVCAERIREELEVAPEELLERLEADPDAMPSAEMIEQDVQRLRRQRDALGAVNLRAEEDAKAVQEEYDTLSTEKTDLEEAIKTLRTGIASLNREGRERLLAAFDVVNRNFTRLFKLLFGGGDANLVLVESDDPLEAGLEIMCQPPGKKLSTLSLLSGGEQTLTALSLIFAVFLANPSPICVLDEVDAPLDDANVTRFCDLLDEMTRQTDTRFLIITHHAVTMARMDRLFGVTMAEQGVSQLVSVDLRQAEEIVDA